MSTPQPQPEPAAAAQGRALLVFAALAFVLLAYRGFESLFVAHPTRRTTVQPVNVNEANRVELLQVPGVGPSMADAILKHRERHGPFSSLESLDDVPGIGEKTRGKLSNWLAVAPVPTVRSQQPDELQKLERKPPPPVVTSSKKLSEGERLSINTATIEDLQKLPGIGMKLAERILEARQREPFKMLDDLRRVSGIGTKTLEKLRPYLVFE